ncbi:hypothetical protein BDF19DRAFT_426276 [Syncephalis fuscata]|nr:hypothetical protein BDF19DRAFT_426276 [Syncephalis fuscata]
MTLRLRVLRPTSGASSASILIPWRPDGNPVTYIKKDPATGIEDGIAENKDDMVKLKKLIKFVSISE